MRQEVLYLLLGAGLQVAQAFPVSWSTDVSQLGAGADLVTRIASSPSRHIPICRRSDPKTAAELKVAIEDNLKVNNLEIHRANPNGGGLLATADKKGPIQGENLNAASLAAAGVTKKQYDASKPEPKTKDGEFERQMPMTNVAATDAKVHLASQQRELPRKPYSAEYEQVMEKNTQQNIQQLPEAELNKLHDANKATLDAKGRKEEASKALEAAIASLKDEQNPSKIKSLNGQLDGKKTAVAKAEIAFSHSQRRLSKITKTCTHPNKCAESEANDLIVKTEGAEKLTGAIMSSAGTLSKDAELKNRLACSNCQKFQTNMGQTDTVAHPDACKRDLSGACARPSRKASAQASSDPVKSRKIPKVPEAEKSNEPAVPPKPASLRSAPVVKAASAAPAQPTKPAIPPKPANLRSATVEKAALHGSKSKRSRI